MLNQKSISEATIKRLPRYYRILQELETSGEIKISSSALANMLNITASKVRQDFCTFGEFGMQGFGYDIKHLKSEISAILGLDRDYNVIIIGAGNIGTALSSYNGFMTEGYHIKAMFDINMSLKCGEIPLYHIDELENYVSNNPVDIAIITTQKTVAESICLRLKDCGVMSVWNFAPCDLRIDGMTIENINMSESLFVLSYRMKNK